MESLRLYKNGFLKTLPVFNEFNMRDLLPLKLESPDEGCIRPSEDVYCFLAGDGRVNEQTVLGMIHTVMAREHNRMAGELSRINPHWNDETIFQEVRHIMGAMHQHITYNEFLPTVLGKEIMQQYDLILVKQGYYNGYDPSINPSVSNVFATAAFRMGHTLLPSTIERWSKTHRYIGSQRLSEMLQQPYDLFKGGWADNYIMGLVNQVAQAYDDSITQEVTNHLFQEPGKKFGLDLAALNTAFPATTVGGSSAAPSLSVTGTRCWDSSPTRLSPLTVTFTPAPKTSTCGLQVCPKSLCPVPSSVPLSPASSASK